MSSLYNNVNDKRSIYEDIACNKLTKMIGLRTNKYSMYELDTGEILPRPHLGDRVWYRGDDEVSLKYSGKEDSDGSIIVENELSVTRNAKRVVEIQAKWKNGALMSIECYSILRNVKDIDSLVDKSYGFDIVSVSYIADHNGSEIGIDGYIDEDHYTKKLVLSKNMYFDRESEETRQSKIPSEKDSYVFYESPNQVVYHYDGKNLSEFRVSNISEMKKHLFLKAHKADRNKNAEEFVLDCLEYEIPNVRHTISKFYDSHSKLYHSMSFYTPAESAEFLFLDQAIAGIKVRQFNNRFIKRDEKVKQYTDKKGE